MPLPKHLQGEKPTPQVRGRQQEGKIAKALNGRTTINSGATFGQNDIILEYGEVESKLTTHKSFTLNVEYFQQVERKCKLNKMPIMHINFEQFNEELMILKKEDFLTLLALIEKG